MKFRREKLKVFTSLHSSPLVKQFCFHHTRSHKSMCSSAQRNQAVRWLDANLWLSVITNIIVAASATWLEVVFIKSLASDSLEEVEVKVSVLWYSCSCCYFFFSPFSLCFSCKLARQTKLAVSSWVSPMIKHQICGKTPTDFSRPCLLRHSRSNRRLETWCFYRLSAANNRKRRGCRTMVEPEIQTHCFSWLGKDTK